MSVTRHGQFSDLFVPSGVAKRYGVISTDFSSISRRILSQKSTTWTHGDPATLQDHTSQSDGSAALRLDSLRDHRQTSSGLDQEPRFGSQQNVASIRKACLLEEGVAVAQWRHLMLRVRLWQETVVAGGRAALRVQAGSRLTPSRVGEVVCLARWSRSLSGASLTAGCHILSEAGTRACSSMMHVRA